MAVWRVTAKCQTGETGFKETHVTVFLATSYLCNVHLAGAGVSGGQLSGTPTYKRAPRRRWNNWKYGVTVNSGLQARRNFSENYPQFGQAPFCPWPKKFKEYRFEGASTCLGPVLLCRVVSDQLPMSSVPKGIVVRFSAGARDFLFPKL
jgi:hypothetical protein